MELARGQLRGKYRRGFKLTMHPEELERPLKWRKPQNIFVNSMSDLFHEDVPLAFIQRVFKTMHRADWHRYQILTKRAARLRELDPHLAWANHIWMGVTVESAACVSRIDDLRDQCLAAGVRFFFKQWGGVRKKRAGRLLDGRTWDELPAASCA